MHQIDEIPRMEVDASLGRIEMAVDVRHFARDVAYFGCTLKILSIQIKRDLT